MDEAVFQPAKREIYRYSVDGTPKTIAADPLALRGKIAQAAIEEGVTVDSLIDTANKGEQKPNASAPTAIEINEAWMALKQLEKISRTAFGLTEYNPETGSGADMAHAIGLLDHFHRFLQKKNQPPAMPSISIPPVESTSATQTIMGT